MLAALVAAAVAAPPNVVLIFADDLGIGEVGAYGQQKVPTPNLDRLAKEGTRFTRFYTASPVCAPSRASLLTGKHTGRSPIRGNKEVGGWELNSGEGQMSLPAAERTIAEGFKERGYATAAIGKWGLGAPGSEGHPNNQGFDTFFGYLCQRQAHNLYPAYLWHNSDVHLLTGNRYYRPSVKITHEQATDETFATFVGKQFAEHELRAQAVKWIELQKERPFFLYYASPMPHVSLQAPPDEVAKFPLEWDPEPYLGQNGYVPAKRPRATYAAMISALDTSVGAILDTLERTGKLDSTLIIFTSDNGPTFLGQVDRAFFNSSAGLRGTKSTGYEGGIRMPMLVRWPGQVPAGRVLDQVSYAPDLMPTLAAVAGFRPGSHDGQNQLAVWRGGASSRRKELYFEFPENGGFLAAIFDDRWKAIRPRLAQGNKSIEIYDLDMDPAEKTDLAASRPDLVRRAERFFALEHRPNPNFPLPGVDSPIK
jgi:arylsulfatase A-like enzyme